MLLNGKAPRPGEIIQLPNLAKTFRSVAEHGKDGFYKGRVAEAIVELIKSKGGVMELEDLAKLCIWGFLGRTLLADEIYLLFSSYSQHTSQPQPKPYCKPHRLQHRKHIYRNDS